MKNLILVCVFCIVTTPVFAQLNEEAQLINNRYPVTYSEILCIANQGAVGYVEGKINRASRAIVDLHILMRQYPGSRSTKILRLAVKRWAVPKCDKKGNDVLATRWALVLFEVKSKL